MKPVAIMIKQTFGRLMKESYKIWSATPEIIAKAGEKPEMRRPADIVWSDTVEVDATKFGEYTLNPGTIGIYWESIPKEKIKVFDFKKFVGKRGWELAEYITKQWPERGKYLIPGMEYWKYILEHPDKAPDSLKDGNWHYFFGSIFRGSCGSWSVPIADWDGSKFDRNGGWLGLGWDSPDRVVLLER